MVTHGNTFYLCFLTLNQGIIMNNPIKFVIPLMFMFSASCYAEKNIVEVSKCNLKENKTMKDAGALNKKWVKFMNANVKGGGINSYYLEPRVGDRDGFMFVDVYPNMQSWGASDNVMESSEEGKALIKEFGLVSKCKSNRLYSSTKT